jgi:hypothetical protein
MAQRTAQQLPLPCTFEEATSLLNDITTLRHTVTWQQSKIATLQEQRDVLQADRETWRELHRLTETKFTAAYAEIVLLGTTLTVMRSVVLNRAPTLPDWLSPELRRLLTMAHPDKWSQGQPATALAHEVAAAIHTLRQRLGEKRV